MKFRNDLYFLSNMYPCSVTINVDGRLVTMKSAESAFQALKFPSRLDEFTALDGFAAKKRAIALRCERRSDWFDISLDIMLYVLRCKFTQHPDLAVKLKAVDGEIVEENEWNDTFWGVCRGKGENHLGKTLMTIREELRTDSND